MGLSCKAFPSKDHLSAFESFASIFFNPHQLCFREQVFILQYNLKSNITYMFNQNKSFMQQSTI